jgi:NAD(P)-dependent dehydrogenase (short-subunit alcohol dehydrogenase family)
MQYETKGLNLMTNPLPLLGLTAVVTGASRGIGRAICLRLAQSGAKVLAVSRPSPDLESLAKTENITPWAGDVTDPNFVDRLKDTPHDILVNNAGMNKPMLIQDVSLSVLDEMLTLNVRSGFLVAQASVKAMLAQGRGGSIVNMTSQMGHVGSPRRSVYCLTKHALEGLTKAMAVELASHNIRVNSVAPTFVETPMTAPMFENEDFKTFVMQRLPMGRLATLDEVAHAVHYLVSPEASIVTGISLKVDGGWTAQ